MAPKALITGITGQDGSYLAELLLEQGYEVHAIMRRSANEIPEHRTWRINHLLGDLTLHDASLENFGSLYTVVSRTEPDECYHLGAQSFVALSFEDPFSTFNTNIGGTLNMLEAVRQCAPRCRFYMAASSEMFGKVHETPQNEETVFHPRSPYGVTKVAGFDLVRNYREAYDLYALSGILYNHESPRRGMEFVTRKITRHAAMIKLGLADEVRLGNLEAKRDWGHAKDYVRAMWLMLQQDQPEDYVVASGETHSVREFAQIAFDQVGLNYEDYVTIDPAFFRPAEVDLLLGDPGKAKAQLGWEPAYSFEDLVREMVDSDLEQVKATLE